MTALVSKSLLRKLGKLQVFRRNGITSGMKFPHTLTNNVMAIIASQNSATQAAREAALRSHPNNASIWRAARAATIPVTLKLNERQVKICFLNRPMKL